MNGIGGQQPINQPLITGDNKATNSNNVEASHGRFKISLPSGIKNFLSALLPSGIMSKSIQSYDVKQMPGIPQQSSITNKNAASQKSGNIPNTPKEVANNPQLMDMFEDISELLDELSHSKGTYEQMSQMNSPRALKRLSTQINEKREELKSAVERFNSKVGNDLKIDSNKIEASSSGKQSKSSGVENNNYEKIIHSLTSGDREQAIHGSATKNNASRLSPFDNALDAAANGGDKKSVKQSFQKVSDSLENVVKCKAELAAKRTSNNRSEMSRVRLDLQLAKIEFKNAVQDFNGLKSLDATLQLNAGDIEMALMYKDDKFLQTSFRREAEQYKEIFNKFEQMKNTLI